ncbi:DUF4124 domain-containing protein [Geobacter sp. FeAm09]|uniref:DUF4124 domain-containing protein n=1 Tax=Geobacter sp. FeAm09 TaxID=2597769 RepID=UPI00197AD934
MAHAEYYAYTDDQGNVHYTDNPSSLSAKALKRAKRVDVDMSPEPPPEVPAASVTTYPDANKPAKKAKKMTKAKRSSGNRPPSSPRSPHSSNHHNQAPSRQSANRPTRH